MTDQTKQKIKYWLIGVFTGGAVAAPITAFFVNKVCDKKIEEAETRGMNIMAEYAVQQQTPNNTTNAGDDISSVRGDIAETDPRDYDTSIDEEKEDAEAHERTIAHERYLDMIEKYNGSLDMIPYIIDEEKFMNEAYMEKAYVNWYEEDNIFEEELMTVDDPYASFGVTNGTELFRDDHVRRDSDIVYVRNEKLVTDYEITRIHGSYAKIVGGETSLGKTVT